MESGKWEVGSGKWKVESLELEAILNNLYRKLKTFIFGYMQVGFFHFFHHESHEFTLIFPFITKAYGRANIHSFAI